MMTTISREMILNARDLPDETVSVPEWKGDVTIRTMTGEEYDDFIAYCQSKTVNGKMEIRRLKAKLIQLTAVDMRGALLFSDSDVEELNSKSAKVLDRLFDVAQRLNGLSDDQVEEFAGN